MCINTIDGFHNFNKLDCVYEEYHEFSNEQLVLYILKLYILYLFLDFIYCPWAEITC